MTTEYHTLGRAVFSSPGSQSGTSGTSPAVPVSVAEADSEYRLPYNTAQH